MMRPPFLLCLGTVLLSSPSLWAAGPEGVEFFEKHVRPVLVQKCQSCHGPAKQRGGLRLDSRAALLKGGDTGPALVPGQPDKSLLVQAVRSVNGAERKMPPRGKEPLDAKAVEALATWVRLGAPWPEERGARGPSTVAEVRKSHWSFKPVGRPVPPAVKSPSWARTPVDLFVLAKLEEKGLSPAPEADRHTLIRRVTFDLIGLPPTPEEVEAFVNNSSPDAYEKLVERLLASPHYGERWGRHWLDIARYADTKGYVFTAERRYPYSYTYRDYVVSSFNHDRPYDTFVLEQLAADQLDLGADRHPLAAMGYLTLGRRFLNNVHDIIDDRLDVTMRGLQGLTVACARCHDHKYDPIPTKDYYSLYGVFASSVEPGDLPLIDTPDSSPARAAFEKELKAREEAVQKLLRELHAEVGSKARSRIGEALLASRESGRRRGGELSPALVARWRTYLQRTKQSKDPVWSAWHAFTALPAAEFASKAPALSAGIAAGKLESAPVNAVVRKAFAGKPPASLADVAKLYGEVFRSVDGRWLQEQKKDPKTANLADPDEEQVRQVLYGPDSPATVPFAEVEKYLDRAQRNRLTPLRSKVEQWKATGPGAPPRAMVLVDTPAPVSPRVFVRGNPGNPGPAVPRQFVEVLAGDGRKPFTKGSGRLELARAIASKDNPLTARVMANRVWQWHFGQGIVRTPSDFGLRGEPPSHPELLDWLASTFMDSSWSVKKLHRLMVLSATYRQSSSLDSPKAATLDPENALLWRMNRRRLEFEPLRDSLLAAAGRLDGRMGGAPVDITVAPYPPRRSVYGFIDRQNLPGVFRTFDLASPDATTGRRHSTTVPQQALFLMNSPFVLEQARAFVARADVSGQKTDAARIDRLHRLAYGRPPAPDELELGLEFVRGAGKSDEGLSAWEEYAQVLLLANEFAFVD